MPQQRKIVFNEALHQYKDEDNKVYTSVTTLIDKYKEKFDENFWAKKKAEELGTTPELIKQNWKEIRDEACNRGNETHKLLEDSINQANGKTTFDPTKVDRGSLGVGVIIVSKTNLHVLQATPLAKKYPSIFAYLRKYIEDGWTLFAEKRVYLAEFLVAGTIDVPLIKGNLFIIVDWKTNKDELKFEAGYYKKVSNIKTDTWIKTNKRLFHPISDLPDCKGELYTIQLSMYAHILEEWGLKCVALVLFHIRPNMTPRPYNITYRKLHCQRLLQHNLKGESTTSSTKFGIKPSNNNPNQFGIF